ncbi:MAG: hypothetical protein FRX49_12110 [Trebouxia sp. A1-2]|nr:MAG: hypothetical protein FRX49_12110 [Trebouxia sp. A1-2]
MPCRGLVHLRRDPDAAVVVTEVLQLYVSVRGAVDTAFVAIRPLEQWTQPFGAWHGMFDQDYRSPTWDKSSMAGLWRVPR